VPFNALTNRRNYRGALLSQDRFFSSECSNLHAVVFVPQDHSLWLTLVGFVVLLEVMRLYFPKISEERVPENSVFAVWVAFGTLWAYFRQKRSLWLSCNAPL
jgi:hypothetical protein